MAGSETALKPAITRNMLLFFIVSDILGGGIYALVGEVGDKVGGAIWTAFAGAAVVAAFTAASYAELVSKYPSAGGAALFVHKAWRAPLFTFLIAFAVMSSGVASAATLATAFGGDYLSEFVDLPSVLAGLVLFLRGRPVDHEHVRAWIGFPVLGAACCVALIVQKLVEDAVIFAYAGGLLAFGLVLWALARAFTGPVREIDPVKLADG